MNHSAPTSRRAPRLRVITERPNMPIDGIASDEVANFLALSRCA